MMFYPVFDVTQYPIRGARLDSLLNQEAGILSAVQLFEIEALF